MSKRRHLLTAAGLGALTTMLLATSAAQGVGPAQGSIVLDADPGAVTIAPLPCDRRGEVALSMTNTGTESEFVDALLTASPGLELSRALWSTYLPPADPEQAVSAPVTVTAAEGTVPDEYELQMTAAEQTLSIPVTIEESPGDGPDANLALYRQAFASTTHPNTTLCGGVDGNRDSAQWAASGIHDRTPEEFPDVFGVELSDAYEIARVEVYTLDSATYPAAEMGIRDFDVEVRTPEGWHTAGSVRGNDEGHISITFPPVLADQVRVVVHDSNDHKYSRIIELEVYQY